MVEGYGVLALITMLLILINVIFKAGEKISHAMINGPMNKVFKEYIKQIGLFVIYITSMLVTLWLLGVIII